MKKLLTLPNILTSLRIAGAACLMFITPLTPAFFVIYTLCGISDVLDGVIARAAHITTELGAKLDSAADLLFYSVMMIRMFPVLWERLPRLIWAYVGLVLALRLASYLTCRKISPFCGAAYIPQQTDGARGVHAPLFHFDGYRHRVFVCGLHRRLPCIHRGTYHTHYPPRVPPGRDDIARPAQKKHRRKVTRNKYGYRLRRAAQPVF